MVNRTLSAPGVPKAMRGVLALLVGLTVVAAPAQAQKLPVKPPPAKSATAALLRGPVDPPAAETPAREEAKAPTAATAALPPLLAPLAPSRPDPGRCRLSCASSYYFCLSSDAPDECPSSWSQCRAACDSPSPALDVATIPAT